MCLEEKPGNGILMQSCTMWFAEQKETITLATLGALHWLHGTFKAGIAGATSGLKL